MKIVAITQARWGSTRFPGKVLKRIHNISLLEIHLKRILKSKLISKTIVATTHEPESALIIDTAVALGAAYYRGSLNDVLDRFYNAVKNEHADYVVRLTSDCPLIDPVLIDNVIEFCINNKLDYASNTLNPTFPDGMDVEVFTFSALKSAWEQAQKLSDREHVTPFIWRNSSYKGGKLFQSQCFVNDVDYSAVRLTVDEPRDFEVINKVVDKLGIDAAWIDYCKLYLHDTSISKLNSTTKRNEGYLKSLNNDNEL